VIPTAAHWAEKYNHAVESASARGIVVVQYLPEIPIEKIAKVFSGNSTEREIVAETNPETEEAQAAFPEPEIGATPTEAADNSNK
jgi:Rubber elongation factor protein (REF)